MDIYIQKLTQELVEDYLHFFDTTPPYTNKPEDRCYCVGWSNTNCESQDFSTAKKRRYAAIEYINGNNIQGYLAYYNNKVVGWCNANTRSDCFECQYGKMYLKGSFDKEMAKVKSVFCFAILPEMRRKGIAEALLNRVCKDSLQDDFDFIEAYPNKKIGSKDNECMGPLKLYEKLGFTVCYDIAHKVIMRKNLH